MSTPASSRHSSRASADREKCNGRNAMLPGVSLSPRFCALVSRRQHSAAPRVREIRFLLCYRGYGLLAARAPERHVSSAGAATRFPLLKYYSSATRPSTPRSNPDCPPPRERTFLLPPLSIPSAASSLAGAAAYNVFRSGPTSRPTSKSVPAYSAHGSRMTLPLPSVVDADIPNNAQYEFATATPRQTFCSDFGYTIHTSRLSGAFCCAFF